jgi:SPP1 gp7 family putative phage head morphogenesis protein
LEKHVILKFEIKSLNLILKILIAILNFIDKDINKILTDGYEEGLGNPEIAKNIKNRFSGLKTWEAQRIAITEVNSAQSLGAYEAYFDDDIDYHQWVSAEDSRVRDTHAIVNGEIVLVGERFSNGLLYPGDRDGELKEWIGCRCTTVPFIVPFGFMVPPGRVRFREEELVKIATQQSNREPDFNIEDDIDLRRELRTQLRGYENKIKFIENVDEVRIDASDMPSQPFKKFRYSPDDIDTTVDIWVINMQDEYIVSDLKWAVKQYNKLAPNFKKELENIFMACSPDNSGTFGYFSPGSKNIYLFRDYIEYYPATMRSTFVHESAHLEEWIDNGIENYPNNIKGWVADGFTKSSNEFKDLFMKNVEDALVNNNNNNNIELYNKFKEVTKNRLNGNNLNINNYFTQEEQDKIEKLFSSNYGYRSWKDYITRNTDFAGNAFSEEYADSVAATITNNIENRAVKENIKNYIINVVWK